MPTPDPAEPRFVPDADALRVARKRLAGIAHRTPVFSSSTLDRHTGARVLLKGENLQRVGAFKFRGAYNAIASLAISPDVPVVTHSSGNHAQAVALAARLLGRRAIIVMPEGAPAVKVAAVRGYGADVVRCAATHAAREATAADILERTDGVLVHPFDDGRVIAGQSTVTAELLEQAGELGVALDLVLGPVGGGGLMSGACLAVHHQTDGGPDVVACEPEGADDAARSLELGVLQGLQTVNTVADGLRTPLSPLTFSILQRHLREIVTVTDAEIVAAMRWIWERTKLVIEPSAAVAVAALMSGRIDTAGRTVGVILSGGNVDLDALPW